MNDTHEYKGHRISIVPDTDSESPNDWGNEEQFLAYDHRQFSVTREGFEVVNISDFLHAKKMVGLGDDEDGSYQEEVDSYPEYNDYYIFPVEAYIHSGVALSLFTGNKTCSFDSSVSGYILSKKGSIDLNKQEKKFKSEEEAHKYFSEGLIETWNQYLSGNVYGYQIETPEISYALHETDLESMLSSGKFTSNEFLDRAETQTEWVERDSCWGFYGDPDGHVLSEAKSVVDNYEKEEN